MKTFHIIKYLFLTTILTLCLAACNHDQKMQAEQDVSLAPGDYITDNPDNVTDYLQNLCQEHGAMVALHSADYEDSMAIWQAIHLLDEYAAGRRKYYPAEEVRHALGALAFNLGYWYSHGAYFDYDDTKDTNYAEIFFFRFLEQAVRLSPLVDYVTDFHSADGTAGILNYHEWSPNPLYSFLVYSTDKGPRICTVGEKGDTKIEKLFHLTDSKGREYYLCSNNMGYCNFRQYLFLCDGYSIREVASCTKFPMSDFDGDIVFNPRLLRWDYCKDNGGTYVRIEGTQSLLLKLDGENSRFLSL